MALDDEIELLARTSPFDLLPPDALRLIAFTAQKLRLASGVALFAEGEIADCAYFVLSGEIALGDTVAKIVGRGVLIGASSLLIETTRPSRAVIHADAIVLKIGRDVFARVLAEFPKSAAGIHARLSERTRAMVKDLNALRARRLV